MPANRVNDAWQTWLMQRFPQMRITCVRNAATFAMGLFQGGSVHLSKIAAEVPGDAQLLSVERRMSRFLDNSALSPELWFDPIAIWWLQWCSQTQKELVILADGSKVSAHHQLLMIALALPNGRALPLVWGWLDCAKGHSSATQQLALLTRLHALVPRNVPVTVVGDTEFGPVAVLQQLTTGWHWNYVMRQKSSNQVRTTPEAEWQPFEALVTCAGSSCFAPNGLLTKQHAFPTALLAVWEKGEKECWLLASSFATASETMRYYRQRMLIEELFGDLKGHGFDLEHTRLRQVERLNRLTLLVCLLYVWLIRTGLMLLLAHRTALVDRHDRRDLSLFQLGVRYIKRLCNNNEAFTVRLCPDNLYDILPVNQIKLSGC